jgi:hypothetical protein
MSQVLQAEENKVRLKVKKSSEDGSVLSRPICKKTLVFLSVRRKKRVSFYLFLRFRSYRFTALQPANDEPTSEIWKFPMQSKLGFSISLYIINEYNVQR